MVDFSVVDLQALLGGKSGLAAFVIAQKRLSSYVNQHVLFQVGLLGEKLPTMDAHELLLLLVDLPDVPVQGVLGTEDELAAETMQLTGSFVNLANVLPQGLGVKVDLATFFARLFQRLLRDVYSGFVLDQAVVSLKPL